MRVGRVNSRFARIADTITPWRVVPPGCRLAGFAGPDSEALWALRSDCALAEQVEDALLTLVRLRQHRRRRLRKNLRRSELGRLGREIGVCDARFRFGQVGCGRRQVVHRRLQPVLHRAQIGTLRRHRVDCGTDLRRACAA